jgi:Asp/Glu/hydantoin racemase
MDKWQGYLQDTADLNQTVSVSGAYLGGHAIGIIAVYLVYPKLPGNVVNATTFSFPVLYKKVSFEIEQLFNGDPALEKMIVDAAKELVADGARAIIGACGYFAHFQKQVAAAVKVPVFMSSLCQIPIIKIGLQPDQKILVMCASGDNVNQEFFSKVGANLDDCVVQDVGSMESFAPIRWGKTVMDNERLTKDLAALAQKVVSEHPEIGAILLECSDLPPYACEIQRATGLPVYDFISLINWVEHAVVQKRYYGFF